MKSQLLKFPLFLAALFLGLGCSIETELPEVKITQHNIKVKGVPSEYSSSEAAQSIRLTLSGQDMAWAQKMNSEVRLHQVTIAANTAHPTALHFIRYLRLTLTEAGSNESAEVMNYARPDGEQGALIQSTLATPIDITAAWNTKNAIMEMVLT